MDIFLHFLHLTAAMIWVGGQIFLGLVLAPTLRKSLGPRERMPLSLAIGKRFKRVSHGALGVLLLTGLWNVRYLVYGALGQFWGTAYGQVFTAKMALLVASLFLGLLHDKKWGPAVVRLAESPESPDFKAAVQRMTFWARINIVVTLGVVYFAAVLRQSSF